MSKNVIIKKMSLESLKSSNYFQTSTYTVSVNLSWGFGISSTLKANVVIITVTRHKTDFDSVTQPSTTRTVVAHCTVHLNKY